MGSITLRTALLVLAGGMLSACVTINIYFPAAAAEKAADKIIEDVYQLKKPQGQEGAKPAEQPAQPKGEETK
jgi:hypothetical protein